MMSLPCQWIRFSKRFHMVVMKTRPWWIVWGKLGFAGNANKDHVACDVLRLQMFGSGQNQSKQHVGNENEKN